MGSYQSNNAMRILSDRYTLLASAFVSLKVDMHLFHASWVHHLMPRYNNQMCLGDKNAFLFFPHEIFIKVLVLLLEFRSSITRLIRLILFQDV